MRVGNCSVVIPEGKERDSGYVELDHGTQYTIRLGNHHYGRRVDAVVVIDGKEQGVFRVNNNDVATLQRSAHDDGRFTFFVADSVQAAEGGVDKIDKFERGLVQVTFNAEKKGIHAQVKSPDMRLCSAGPDAYGAATKSFRGGAGGQSASRGFDAEAKPSASTDYAAGITAMTGKSTQTFTEVPNLDYDPAEKVVISLRLVQSRPAVREMKSGPQSNPVPDAVD